MMNSMMLISLLLMSSNRLMSTYHAGKEHALRCKHEGTSV